MVDFTSVLKAEYEGLFAQSAVRPEFLGDVDREVDRIFGDMAMTRYRAVEAATQVPAHVVGIIHVREASGNFACHLHNGDPLSARTRHVPAGRPITGAPPFTWIESAIDALTMPGQALDKWRDWSIGGIAYVLERYNGFGYRLYHNINSPYLWGGTTAYDRGMYVADGTWSATAVNKNPGGMAMLMRMLSRNLVGIDHSPVPGPAPADPPVPVVNPIELIRQAQRALGFTGDDVDGDPGPLTRAAASKYRAQHPGA